MITGGIDVGIEAIKVVVLKDGKLVGKAFGLSGGGLRSQSVERVWQEAMDMAAVSVPDIKKVVATGQGKSDVKFAADRIVEPVADVRAARFLYPGSRAVLDGGADQIRFVTWDGDGVITEVVLNQKCSAGIGIFLRSLSEMLDVDFSEVTGSETTLVNDACPVFAGLDAVCLLHNNVSRPVILGAAVDALAVRLNGILNDKVMPEKETTVLVGGLAKNQALVAALKKRSGIDFLIPEDPEFVCALGAALIAAE